MPPGRPLLYVGQQPASDYGAATLAKFAAARERALSGATTAVIWHDADRAGSERLAMRIVLPLGRRRRGIWLAARRFEDREGRWVPVERAQLMDAVSQLREWARNALPGDREAAPPVDRLAEALLADDVDTVARACAALATVLLREQLGLSAPAVFVSELVGAGLLDAALDVYLARLDEVVRVFNAVRDELLARDIDPRVRALGEDHLPLHLPARSDRARLTLVHERRGRDHFAVATCRCGRAYRFHLGPGEPSLGELAGTADWSPGITLPILHDALVSGWIAGRSSGGYGSCSTRWPTRVRTPARSGVPAAGVVGDAGQPESLLLAYLTGGAGSCRGCGHDRGRASGRRPPGRRRVRLRRHPPARRRRRSAVVMVDLTAGELSTRGDPDTRERERRRATELLGLPGASASGSRTAGSAASRSIAMPSQRSSVGLRRGSSSRPTPRTATPTTPRPAASWRRLLLRRRCEGRPGSAASPAPRVPLHAPPAVRARFRGRRLGVWDRRLQLATVYESQIGDEADDRVTALSGGRFLDVLAARATFYGAMIGAERGEPFNCRGPLALAVCRSSGRSSRRTRVPLDDLGARPARRR